MVSPSGHVAADTSDEALAEMVAVADLPSLLAALAHDGGRLDLAEHGLAIDPARHHEPNGGWSQEQQSVARDIALAELIGLRDAGWPPGPVPTTELVRPIMTWLMASDATDDHIRLLLEELGDPHVDRRAPDWTRDEIAPDRSFRVAVVGAGMSGLLAAHRLREAGVDVVVFEKNADVGGTWLENSYPGCRVDVASHAFCYSFAQRDDWPQHFSTQPVLLDYFRTCADDLGLRPLIRFSTEVESMSFHDDAATWEIRTVDASGRRGERFDAVVNATGQLNRPKMPAIDGRQTFAGPSFHSARWQHDVDVTGRRVAVIGTGASAAQFIPVIAEHAAEVIVLQRTPNWLAPTLDYHDDVADGQRWLLRHVPYYSQWYRFWLFWRHAEGILPAVAVDPDWAGDRERAVSARNDELRVLLAMYIDLCFADRPDLAAQTMPAYPPGAKRILRDNGIWAATLKRDNVTLVTDPIARIEPKGVRTDDGTLHEADVIVYATGFEASRFLTPMRVTGRSGIELHDQWDGNARAYLGIVVPNFPNFFMLYGPNTNIVVNGSIIYFSECEVHYMLQCVRHILATGVPAIDCRAEVHDRYNARIDEGNRSMAWGASTVNSWYKSDSGRVAQNWPFSLLEFWQQTRTIDPADYEVVGALTSRV